MDIAALANAMALGNVQNTWSMGMLDKTLDVSKQQGSQIVDMIQSVSPAQMELSVNPYVGSQFDVSV